MKPRLISGAMGLNFYGTLLVAALVAFAATGATKAMADPPDNPGGGQGGGQGGGGGGNKPPVVSTIDPNAGTTLGGTSVTISGKHFASGATVTIGDVDASVTVLKPKTITATTGAHPAGIVDVVVTNPDGQSGILVDGFTYAAFPVPPTVTSITPSSGPPAGGTAVTIAGTDFVSGAALIIGGIDAAGVFVDATTMTGTTPPGVAGPADVVVTNPDGLSGSLVGGFTYVPPPSVIGIDPSAGTTLGGDAVTITGTDFVSGAALTIGGIDAAGVFVDATTMTGTTPPGVAGPVDVVVTNPDGQSGTLAAGFTYQPPIFTDVTISASVDFLHQRDASLLPLGAGVVVLDYNNDGNQDIYVPNSAEGANALYRNNGDGTFTDVAITAGVDDPLGAGNGGCSADYDNDGYPDLFVTNWGSSKLFRNNGNDTFTDVTAFAGVSDPDPTYRSTGCAWGDYDQDSFLDLIVVRHLDESDPSVFTTRDFSTAVRVLALHHNNGNGTFTDVTSLLGDTSGPFMGEHGESLGNVWGAGFQPGFVDFDNDGDPDIYVVNDFGVEVQANVLWRNDGAAGDGTWSFFDASTGSGTDVALFGMGLAVGDYNVDGFLDFHMTNIGDTVLLANNGDGLTFTNRTMEAGVGIGIVGGQFRVTWGNVFFDYDNDGDEDLYVVSGFLDSDPQLNVVEQPNVLLRNNGDGSFADVSSVSGADDPGIGRGGVYADFNNDGCLDLYVANLGQRAKLFQNNCDSGNGWLSIKTVGTSSNRDGIGARVTVVSGGSTQIREVASGASNKSQNMLPVHFGLGTATVVDSVEVRWPSGTVQTLTNVAVNQRLTITEAP